MTFKTAAIRAMAFPIVLSSTASCANLWTLAEVLATSGTYETPREVNGQIRSIDTRRQEIRIEDEWGGSDLIRYDGRTQVVYGQRSYQVRDLGRGDVVWMNIESRSGELYTNYIEVQRSTLARSGSGSGRVVNGSRVQRVEGSVMLVDERRGYFDIDQGRGNVVTVTLPQDASRAMRDRLRRLRRGERVRLEAQAVNTWTVELLRFL